jgi:hypothetical protein
MRTKKFLVFTVGTPPSLQNIDILSNLIYNIEATGCSPFQTRRTRMELINAIKNHIVLVIAIVISIIIWGITNSLYPGVYYNPFKYLLLTDNIYSSVLGCWPLFLYCIVTVVIIHYITSRRLLWRERNFDKGKTLAVNIYVSIMAGLLEEVGYRGAFIFLGMASIAVTDFFFFGVSTWLVQNISLPLVDLITFGLMHNVLYGFPVLLMGGALTANIWFRDGHEYLGFVGFVNSWFVGLYMITIMLTQGLIVAIIAHAIYDLIIAFMDFGFNYAEDRADNRNNIST